jgi:hypothetical protein
MAWKSGLSACSHCLARFLWRSRHFANLAETENGDDGSGEDAGGADVDGADVDGEAVAVEERLHGRVSVGGSKGVGDAADGSFCDVLRLVGCGRSDADREVVDGGRRRKGC